MFNLIIALLIILFVAVPAEARIDIDGTIAAMLVNIKNAKSKEDQESLSATNDKLQSYLARADLRGALLRNKLPNAEKAGLTVLTSDDKNLRVFSWDTQMGGTKHCSDSMALFNAGGQLKSTDLNSQTEYEAGSFYEHIDQIATADLKTVYLLRDLIIGSHLIRSRSVQAYVIQNGRLRKFPIFRTKTQKLDTIGIGVENDQVQIGISKEDNEDIKITEKGHKVSIPLIDKDNKPTGKYLVYVFDGHNFVFSGTSK